MKKRTLITLWLTIILAGCDSPKSEVSSEYFDIYETPVGDVNFPNSCNAMASPLIERGVALLHHMMYEEANFLFSRASEEDPECAIAFWGKSMSKIHPLWPGVPSESDIRTGNKLVSKASSIQGSTDREKAYLSTTNAYFNLKGVSRGERLKAFESAWEQVAHQFPEDDEARAFYALSRIATSDKSDTTYTQQRKAALIAEKVIKTNPKHPGAHHYIIHAYDVPGYANLATDVVKSYGEMTPKVPHAAHMLSHIYTRLGDWKNSIRWNKTSSETAWEMCLDNGEINMHFTHALDYLAYAYLQQGEDKAVESLLETIAELKGPYEKTNHASAYAFSAIPARYAAERQDWNAATELTPRYPDDFPWSPAHDPYVAITHFVKAVSFARLGRPEEAEDDITQLAHLKKQIEEKNDYWALQVAIQLQAASAWQSFMLGDKERGLRMMSEAATMELSTQKHPITPGAIIPANELYGDMLFEAGLFEKAKEAYQASLERNPKRLNTLIGLTNASVAIKDTDAAKNYYAAIEAQVSELKSLNRKSLPSAESLSGSI